MGFLCAKCVDGGRDTLQLKNKNIRPEEIQLALDEQLTLATLIQYARVRLDAIQLILCR